MAEVVGAHALAHAKAHAKALVHMKAHGKGHAKAHDGNMGNLMAGVCESPWKSSGKAHEKLWQGMGKPPEQIMANAHT